MKFLMLIILLISCTSKNSSDDRTPASIVELVKLYSIPGLAGAYFNGEAAPEMSFEGVKKYGFDAPLEKGDVFHLGSCTKAMTASLAALIIEEGNLSWTSTLGELLPDVEMHPSYQNMTFETLLVHRAGLPAGHEVFHTVRNMEPVAGRELITKTLLSETPESIPGSKFTYTNYGYIIAGHILEKVTDASWESLLTEKIFVPLKMPSCGLGVTSNREELYPDSVWGHEKKSDLIIPRHFDNPPAFGPSSLVHCSLEDWGKFLLVHMKGFKGEGNFHKSETFKKLHSVHPSRDSSYTYGGWNLLERNWAGGATLSHSGSNTINYARVWIAPEINSVFVSTANIGGQEAADATDALIQRMIKSFL